MKFWCNGTKKNALNRLKIVSNWFGFLSFQEYGMIPTIFRYNIQNQANPYQKRNSNSIHYGFRGQNHNPDLRFNPIPIQSIPMKSRFKHLENGVYGKSTKRRLQDVSIPDFSTTIHFNHELFNHELSLQPWTFSSTMNLLFNHEIFQPRYFQPEIWGWKL